MTKMICPIMSAARMANPGADFRRELINRDSPDTAEHHRVWERGREVTFSLDNMVPCLWENCPWAYKCYPHQPAPVPEKTKKKSGYSR